MTRTVLLLEKRTISFAFNLFRYFYVHIVKEFQEQSQEYEVDDERKPCAGGGDVAVVPKPLLDDGIDADNASDDHLYDLHDRDRSVDDARDLDQAGGSERVVAVHDRVDDVVGRDEITH